MDNNIIIGRRDELYNKVLMDKKAFNVFLTFITISFIIIATIVMVRYYIKYNIVEHDNTQLFIIDKGIVRSCAPNRLADLLKKYIQAMIDVDKTHIVFSKDDLLILKHDLHLAALRMSHDDELRLIEKMALIEDEYHISDLYGTAVGETPRGKKVDMSKFDIIIDTIKYAAIIIMSLNETNKCIEKYINITNIKNAIQMIKSQIDKRNNDLSLANGNIKIVPVLDDDNNEPLIIHETRDNVLYSGETTLIDKVRQQEMRLNPEQRYTIKRACKTKTKGICTQLSNEFNGGYSDVYTSELDAIFTTPAEKLKPNIYNRVEYRPYMKESMVNREAIFACIDTKKERHFNIDECRKIHEERRNALEPIKRSLESDYDYLDG